MKKCLIALLAVMLCALAGCGGGEGGQTVIPEGYTRVNLEESTGVKVSGIGVQFDPHYFSQNVSRNVPGLDESGWELICERVKKMGIDKFRVMLLPEWLEPENDNDDSAAIDWSSLTPDSLEMQSLYKLLDLAEEADIEVTLVLWGVSKTASLAANGYDSKSYFMGEGNNSPNWIVGASGAMIDEYVENFSAYIQLLVNQKGYTCIAEATPGNEPDWSWQINGQSLGDFNAYLEMCLKLDARFKADGIRDKVAFNLVDTTYDCNEQWLQLGADNLEGIADVMNTHTYNFGYQTPNSTVRAWERNNAAISRSIGAAHFVGEFGSNLCVGSTRQTDIDDYERGVYLVRMMNNFFNGGACGMSYWTLNDYYINKKANYEQMMQLGLFRSAKDEYKSETNYRQLTDFQVRDQYYAYSLMSRYVPVGADVYPMEINDELTAGTAFEKDGKTVYSIANGGGTSHKFSVVRGAGEFEYYLYREGSLPEGDELISASQTISVKDGCLSFEVPAHTVVLLRQK